jgi:hypothetical protein
MLTSILLRYAGRCCASFLTSSVLVACGGDAQRDDPTGASTATTSSTGSGEGGAGGDASGPGGAGGGAGGDGGSAQGGAGGGGGEGGAPSPSCAAAAKIIVSDPTLDAGPDGAWSPGESVLLTVTLTGPEDNFEYPGVKVVADHPGIGPAENTLFGIFGNEPTPVQVGLSADAGVPSGTKVKLTATVTILNQQCEDLSSVDLDTTIE